MANALLMIIYTNDITPLGLIETPEIHVLQRYRPLMGLLRVTIPSKLDMEHS